MTVVREIRHICISDIAAAKVRSRQFHCSLPSQRFGVRWLAALVLCGSCWSGYSFVKPESDRFRD
ncbi:hypothetical protein NDI49_23690 [Trichocoleus sp. ST-U3]|uniref:hypothetical protein n=1 Tax=Coleofasciculus sp. FACHB-542 TaxID=2692787 RepID=UPI001686A172|nr:hypothetical protein [Coleofasciculus sp. FACHB-542]MBD2083471.1 hypothetical protein [Coleofasciculus sp. FACHB-542]